MQGPKSPYCVLPRPTLVFYVVYITHLMNVSCPVSPFSPHCTFAGARPGASCLSVLHTSHFQRPQRVCVGFVWRRGIVIFLGKGPKKKCKSVVFDQNVEILRPKKFLNILPRMGLPLVVWKSIFCLKIQEQRAVRPIFFAFPNNAVLSWFQLVSISLSLTNLLDLSQNY